MKGGEVDFGRVCIGETSRRYVALRNDGALSTDFSVTTDGKKTVRKLEIGMNMSHPRQLIFLRKSDCLGCAVLLCLVVCLTLLASFFLPSHLPLKHVHTYIHVN